MKPPSIPWKKGKQEEYSCFSLEVEICQDQKGLVWSNHDYLGDKDRKIALDLPGAGAEQIAFALLTEALRREVFVSVLFKVQEDPDFLKKWSPGDQEKTQAELVGVVTQNLQNLMERMIPGCVQEILKMMTED